MRPGMKMLLLSGRGQEHGDGRDTRAAQSYSSAEMNYGGAAGRYRGYAERGGSEMGYTAGYGADSRYDTPDSRYRRDGRGRFTSGGEYASMEGYRPMNRIGFDTGSEMGYEYRSTVDYPRMDEMEHRQSPTEMGHAKGHGNMKLTMEMAEEWMAGLVNDDEHHTKGPHWSLEQAKQVMAQKGVRADALEFWAVLNAMYADYCKVLKKHGIGDKLDAYIDLAKAFIEDKDAGEGKVVKYFENIVKH